MPRDIGYMYRDRDSVASLVPIYYVRPPYNILTGSIYPFINTPRCIYM